jgi:hypothetical protein
MMENRDSTLRLPMFHGMGKYDMEYHFFMCKEIWSVKRIACEVENISQLETMLSPNIGSLPLNWGMLY